MPASTMTSWDSNNSHTPDPPFMDTNEIEAIKRCLALFDKPIDVLEWGSGNSTLFFSAFLKDGSTWLALEHNEQWYKEIETKIKAFSSSIAAIKYIPADRPFEELTDGDYATFRSYILFPIKLKKTYDVIIVDGRARVECLAVGWELLKENGVMILHDAQRKEYCSGIPEASLSIRIENPDVLVEGPISTLFMFKQQKIAKSLADKLMTCLDKKIRLELCNMDGDENSSQLQYSNIKDKAALTWEMLGRFEKIRLYAGDIPENDKYDGWIGLSITKCDHRHVWHDITKTFPLAENTVDAFQAEDVFEHISYDKLLPVLNEIFRVLKPGGTFRLSVPDYGCDVLSGRSLKDGSGNIVFDPGGGGTVEKPGHVWFPRFDSVRKLLEQTDFCNSGSIEYLHYFNMDGSFVVKPIDYSKGYVGRTPDFDERVSDPYRPMSIVVDLIKGLAPTDTPCAELTQPPKTYFIETILGCNLKCPECAVGGGFVSRRKSMMSFEQFKDIADKIRPYAQYVYLFIWGEPLLNPDIFKIIKYTSQFAPCCISTNCKSLTKEKAEALILSGVRDVIVSIDGVSQDVYEQYRVGGDVNEAFSVLSMLCEVNRHHGCRVNISPQFVVFNHNQHEMPLFEKKCSELGIKPTFKAPYIRNGNSRYRYCTNPVYQRPHFSDIDELRRAMSHCPDPREVFTVLVDGSVVLCCNDHNGSRIFGNLFSSSVLEIWNSTDFFECRKAIVAGNAPLFCIENCMVWFLGDNKVVTDDKLTRYQQLLNYKSRMMDDVHGSVPACHKPADLSVHDILEQENTDNLSGEKLCVFINTYYQAFLNDHYIKNKIAVTASYQCQKELLNSECFGDSDFYSKSLSIFNWDADELIVNCIQLQHAWARENKFDGEIFDIFLEQIRRIQPDVVYFQDLNICNEELLCAIRPHTRMIVGQIASPVPPSAFLVGFDIIISSFPHFVERFRREGITSYYQPLAFEPRVLDAVPRYSYEMRPVECSFVGGLSPLHNKGYGLLEYLANEVPINYWGYGVATLPSDSAIRARHHGEVWGKDMFKVLASSKITVNRHIDVAENNANNMRLFEATGCGALLLTDYKDNLNELFEIGKEVVAYRSQEECAALIKYYLGHPDEAAAIARAGQERTLREHTYRLRMAHTAEILERHLRYTRERNTSAMPDRISDGHQEITPADVTQAMESAWKTPTIPRQQRALVQIQLDQMYHGDVATPFQVLANILMPLIRNGDTFLEIGCSSGYYYEIIEYLCNKRITYTGVDYSQPMIDLARDYYPAIKFFTADGANLFFADRSFHIVISSCVLLHTPNWRQHVFETVRVAEKYVVASRTPICKSRPTCYMKKFAYGVETVELRFNEEEFVREFLLCGLKLVDAVQYQAAPSDDAYEVTYLFCRP